MRRRRKEEVYKKQQQIDALINFLIGAVIFSIGAAVIFLFFTFGAADRGVGDVVFGLDAVCGARVFLFSDRHVWQRGSLQNGMVKARVLITNTNSAVHCFEVSREKK